MRMPEGVARVVAAATAVDDAEVGVRAVGVGVTAAIDDDDDEAGAEVGARVPAVSAAPALAGRAAWTGLHTGTSSPHMCS